MMNEKLSVREIKFSDLELISDYWIHSDHDFMKGMGVDMQKIPSREQLTEMLSEQIHQSYPDKKSYCIIWEMDGIPVGHSNVNKIVFGQEAYMHIHLWSADTRKKGCGLQFMQMTIPLFFKNLELKKLCCEPYALNPAPNKTLAKLGFTFVNEYTTTPGWINFEQEVKLWELTKSDFEK